MLPVLAALQLATATAPQSIVVRNATLTQRVALVVTAGGPMLRPELLAPIVNVSVIRQAPGRFRLTVSTVSMVLETGSATVSIAGQVRQLATPPIEDRSRLLVPLQLVSEILPAFVANLRWDNSSRQLVVFSAVGSIARGAHGTRDSSKSVRRANDARAGERSGPRTVVVDAGHGGPDNGMTGPLRETTWLYEKQVTLAVSKRLGRELQSRGLRVVYTRTTDTLIALSDRGRLANQASGDLFISIHVNAANPGWRDPAAARGFETYFLAEAKTEDARRVEQMENESVRYESGSDLQKDDALSFILSDMKQNEHLRESSKLAEIIQERLATTHPGPNRGVKQAGFRVLVTAFMPAVLVEIGFGTNAQEAAFLNDPSRQEAIAHAISEAAVEYLRRYEQRVSGGANR